MLSSFRGKLHLLESLLEAVRARAAHAVDAVHAGRPRGGGGRGGGHAEVVLDRVSWRKVFFCVSTDFIHQLFTILMAFYHSIYGPQIHNFLN